MRLPNFFYKWPIDTVIFSERAGKEELTLDKARYVKKRNGENYLWLMKAKEKCPPTAFDHIWKSSNSKRRMLFLAKYGKGFYDPMDATVIKGKEFAGKLVSKGDELNQAMRMLLEDTRRVNEVFSEPSFMERYGAFLTAVLVLVLGIIFMYVTVKNLGGVASALGKVADRLQIIPFMVLAWQTKRTTTRKTRKT